MTTKCKICGKESDASRFCSVLHQNEFNQIKRRVKRMRDNDALRNAQTKPEIDNKVWRIKSKWLVS